MSTDLQLSLELDARSIWAVFRGGEHALSIIEDNLVEKISQGLGAVRRKSMRPWFREPGMLRLLAGLVPWCWPERSYPRVWNLPLADLEAGLTQLVHWGWRDYQVEAVRQAVLAPLGRGIVSVGTGGGKTRIAWGIAFVCGGEWQYVVHGKDLVRQTGEAFAKLSRDYSPVNVRAWSWAQLPIVGAGVLVDECHQAAARNRAKRLGAGKWGWRIGLSGSALDRTDARNPMTVGFFGPEVASVSVRQMMEAGHLSPGKVRVVRFQ